MDERHDTPEYQAQIEEYWLWADGELSEISDEAMAAGRAELAATKQIMRDALQQVLAERGER